MTITELEEGEKPCEEVNKYVEELNQREELEEVFYDYEQLREMAQKNFILVKSQNQNSGVEVCDDTCFPFTSFTNSKKFGEELINLYCQGADFDEDTKEKLAKFTQEVLYNSVPHNNKQSEMGHCVSQIGPALDHFYRFKLKEYNIVSNRNVEVNNCIRSPDKKSINAKVGGKKPDFFLKQELCEGISITPLWYLHEEKIEERQLKDDFVKLCNLARGALDW